MKTFNNLFGKSASIKNIADFNHVSLSVSQMNAIKGGTEPVLTTPIVTPPIRPTDQI
jgi:hypothetical protein